MTIFAMGTIICGGGDTTCAMLGCMPSSVDALRPGEPCQRSFDSRFRINVPSVEHGILLALWRKTHLIMDWNALVVDFASLCRGRLGDRFASIHRVARQFGRVARQFGRWARQFGRLAR